MGNEIRIWAPILKQNDRPTISMAICWHGEQPPDPEQYRNLLEVAIDALIRADPKQALRDLREVSSPGYPGFYPGLKWQPFHQWAFLIMLSDEMARLLNRIDWQKVSPVQEVSDEDLPGFMDILQML